MVCVQDRQDPNATLCHQEDTAVLTLSKCHILCFSSSRTPGSARFLFLSISHTLSHFLFAKLFYVFSVTDLISSPQFPFHFLPFSLQVSLTLTTSSLSASRLSPSCFPPNGIRLRCSLLVRC